MSQGIVLAKMIAMASSIGNGANASTGLPSRHQIEETYRWDLSAIYPSEKAWLADIQLVQDDLIPALVSLRGQLTTPETVLTCLQLNDEAGKVFSNIYVWANMTYHENMADNRLAERSARADSLNAQLSAASSFIRPELLEQPESVLRSYMDMNEFSDYHHLFDRLIILQPHTLSASEEELLARLREFTATPEDIFQKLSIADMTYPTILDDTGQEVQLSPGVLMRFLQNQDRDFRQRAYQGLSAGFRNARNTLAATLSAEVKKNWYYAQARRYPSSLEASLGSEFIPRAVYDNLVKAVNNQLSHLHRYLELRRKVLGIDQVYIWDMYVPLIPDMTIEIPFEEAKQLLISGTAPLGKDYQNDVEMTLTNRWVDVYETEHKRTGAYAWGTYLSHPFILLNYDGTAHDLITLAHEMGHALHFYYTFNEQPYGKTSIPIFTAEVASTVNEFLMFESLLEQAETPRKRLYYLNTLVENIRSTVYTQVMYAEFEQVIHQRIESGQALSADSISELWSDILQKYYGPNFMLEESVKVCWSRIPHFYYNFYVYKYATSLAAAYDISSRILAGEPEAVENYRTFLAAGDSGFPVSVIGITGVDMTQPEVVENLLKHFGELVEELELLLLES